MLLEDATEALRARHVNDEDLFNRLAELEREPRSERWSERGAMRLCSLYEAATAAQRQFMRESVQVGRWRTPRLDTEDGIGGIPVAERIRVALLLESIENGRHDPRDNLVSLGVIHRSAVAAGIDVERLFEEVAAISSDSMAKVLRDVAVRRR